MQLDDGTARNSISRKDLSKHMNEVQRYMSAKLKYYN